MLYSAAGAGCEFVANNVAPFLQNLVDNIRFRRGRSCAGGRLARQARPVRPSCAAGEGCQAGEAGQAIMCWEAGCQAGEAGQAIMCWGAGCQAGEASQAVMCMSWGEGGGGGWCAGQARSAGHHVLPLL